MATSEIWSTTVASISLFISLIFSVIALITNKKNSKMRKDWENYKKQMNEKEQKNQEERNKILKTGINDLVKTMKDSWKGDSINLSIQFGNLTPKAKRTKKERTNLSFSNSLEKRNLKEKKIDKVKS